jgi:hypothetical protein
MITDLVCFDDITLMGDETDDELVQLEQDMYHVTIEDHGENADDPDRGFGLDQRLSRSAGVDDADIASMQHEIGAEWQKDPRVKHVAATITETAGSGNAGRTYSIRMEAETDAGHLSAVYTTPTGAIAGGT